MNHITEEQKQQVADLARVVMQHTGDETAAAAIKAEAMHQVMIGAYYSHTLHDTCDIMELAED